ncbi:unnamed protein product [Ilex paraguariensis]|uniref:Uncharacterized protein n=1 Tax=Ilex paraguariensis TaxID=185542 RepID=A0ABC8V3K3_9AQUA
MWILLLADHQRGIVILHKTMKIVESDTVALLSYLSSVAAAGEQQRKLYSRVQLLLESMHIPPASAVEHLAPTNSYGGSSILVKAEVTRGVVVCTEDALSIKLGESTCEHGCGCNMPRADLGKKRTHCRSGFVFCLFFNVYFGYNVAFQHSTFDQTGQVRREFYFALK